MEIVLYVYDANVEQIVARSKQLGVTQVNMLVAGMPGVHETGAPDAAALRATVRALADEGIALTSANGATGRNVDVLLDPTAARPAIDAQLRTVDALGEAGIGALLYYQHFPYPEARADEERYWDGLIAFMRELVARAEAADVRIANHPVWRCLPSATKQVALGRQITMEAYPDYRDVGWDGPYLVSSHRDAIRLLDAVPSTHNGVCFCTGMHIMGADAPAMVETFNGRIYHAQMRDVRGRWPHADEVFLGEGEVEFAAVLSLLHEAGYRGVIGPEHLGEPRWEGDDPEAAAMRFLRERMPAAG